MHINYRVNEPITADQFIELLQASTLCERRSIDDPNCMEGMVKNCDLLVTAWDSNRLIGVTRSITDFDYACYLSDLAVHKRCRHRAIGRQLQVTTQEQLGTRRKLIFVAAPAANAYYARIEYTHNLRCWILACDQPIGKAANSGAH